MLTVRWISGVLLLGLLLGCGGAGSTRVEQTVTGKVTFEGQPVTEGTVQFEDTASGLGGSAALSAEGTYSVTLADGSYKVAVMPPTEMTPDTESSPGGEVVKEVKNIPENYRTFAKSPLNAQVAAERLTHDFELMP